MRKLKHFTDFHLRKRLADSLVLSRLDYCDSVYSPLPGYLLKRLQKIEFAAASFVYGRYVNDIGDILKLNWLPVKERRDFNLLKLTFKALHAKQWPSYLNLQRVSIRRGLRSSDSIRFRAFTIYQKIPEISVGNFRPVQSRSICQVGPRELTRGA